MAGESAEQLIINRLAQAPSFHPSGAKLFVPDWTLDPGDVVTVQSDGESYDVPIYSMDLTWNGACRADIQSTGNQQREPLSALRRKEYQAGRRGYGQFKKIDDEFKEFETWQEQTDETIGTYAAQFVDILGDGTNEGRLTIAETAIEQTASDATITAQAAGILLDADGHPILDARGKYQYDPNAADTTLIAQINTNATEILAKVSQSDLNTTLTSYLQINAFSTELASTLDNGDTTLAAKIITAVNKNTNTSSVVISADQINLDGVVTAVFLDSRMANIDKLFTSEGTALEITAGTANLMNLNWLSGDSDSDSVGLKTIRVNGVAPTNIGFLGIGSDTILDINTVGIVSASVSNNILTLTDTAGNHVNFSKATSVSGEWGSNQQGQPTGVFTVTATQTNRNTTTGQDETTTVGTVLTSITQAGHWGNTSNQEDPNTYYQSTNATIDTRQQLYAVKTAEINASSRYIAGQNSVVSTFTKAQSLPSGITPTDFNAGELWRYHVTKDGVDVADAYYRVLNGGGGSYYATFLDNITLESTDISDSVTKYSVANYSDGHRDSAANTRVVIDASAVYSAGVTAGLGGVVNVVKSSWSAGQCDFDPSTGTGQSQEVNLSYSIVKPGFYSSTDETTINVLDGGSSVGLPLNLLICRRQFGSYNYACLFKNGDSLTQGNVLAKFSIDGSAVISDVASILQNGRITYQDADKKIANIPVTAYDDEDNALLSTTITADMSDTWDAGYETGYTQGSGVSILDQYSTTIDSNNTTITLLPSDKGNYNVMASAKVKVEVPPVYRIAQRVASTIVLPNTHKATETIYGNHVMYDVGPNSDNFNVTIDASAVYAQGVTDGASINIKAEERKTISEVQTNITITPTSVGGVSYGAMQKAIVYVNLPRIKDNEDLGTIQVSASSTPLTVNPTGGYGAMKKATGTITVSYDNPSISSSVFISGNATSPIRTLTLHSGNHGYIQIDSTANGKQTTKYVQINVT